MGTTHETCHVPIVINGVEEAEHGRDNDPAARMGKCARDLARALGRPPTANETLAEYHRLNLNTGEDDDGNRAKLAEQNSQWVLKTFRAGTANSFDLNTHLSIITHHVRSEHIGKTKQKNRYPFTPEQMAVVLYSVERVSTTAHPNHRYQFGLPNTSVVTMLEQLGHPINGTTEDTQRRTISAIKQTLEAAKLITTVDPTWRWGNGAGRGKKYGLGPAHPRHAVYLDLARRLNASSKSEVPETVDNADYERPKTDEIF